MRAQVDWAGYAHYDVRRSERSERSSVSLGFGRSDGLGRAFVGNARPDFASGWIFTFEITTIRRGVPAIIHKIAIGLHIAHGSAVLSISDGAGGGVTLLIMSAAFSAIAITVA